MLASKVNEKNAAWIICNPSAFVLGIF